MFLFHTNCCAGQYHFLLCIQSIPGVEESAELSSSELASSRFFGDQKVSIPALLAVLCHKATRMNDDYLPPGCLSQEEHTEVV